MTPLSLDANKLYVFVAGPGKGESIVIRVPPNEWIVIDSCRNSKRVFALEVLRAYSGNHACLVLTHRHIDHYCGMSDLASAFDWKFLACNDRTLVDPDATVDGEEKLAGELGQVFAIFRHRWNSDPSSEWRTWRGTTRNIGDVELLTLHPDEGFARKFEIKTRADENVLSSAMLLRWKDHLLLLAADTPNPHWKEISEHFASEFDIATHKIAKIPHHGSNGALDDVVLSSVPDDQMWIVTPFNSKGLPRSLPGDGLEFLSTRNSLLHLTGLPVGQAQQREYPVQTTLADLRAERVPRSRPITLPGRTGVDVTPDSVGLNNYYVVSLNSDGNVELVHSANGTVIISNHA